MLDLPLQRDRAQFVAFGIDQGEGDGSFPEFVDEVAVDLLQVVAGIEQDEQQDEVLAVENVVADDILQLFPALVSHLGIAVAGQVHKVPGVVDQEMIDQLGLAGRGRGVCQAFFAAEPVDERRFSDIAPADEGEFRVNGLRLLVRALAASSKEGLLDDHSCGKLSRAKVRNLIEIFPYICEH